VHYPGQRRLAYLFLIALCFLIVLGLLTLLLPLGDLSWSPQHGATRQYGDKLGLLCLAFSLIIPCYLALRLPNAIGTVVKLSSDGLTVRGLVGKARRLPITEPIWAERWHFPHCYRIHVGNNCFFLNLNSVRK
jgi:uncharacterized RDD family membrane protein YckC